MKTKRELVQELLAPAGIVINGRNPWDPQVHDERMYGRLFSSGLIAIGEGYMDGWWDSDDIPETVSRIMRSPQMAKLFRTNLLPVVLAYARQKLFNLQTVRRAWQVGEHHYDIGNDLYERMLDKRLAYSCGYWTRSTGSTSSPQASSGQQVAKTLDEAQEAKLDLICRKIGLKKGDRVLDIGCGWGSFAIYAAQKYGARVVGVTISKEQVELARLRGKGLPVEFRLQDYRAISDGPYDHIVSVGMFEHVGPKNHRTYMQAVRRLLKDDGLFLLHTIAHRRTSAVPDPWIHKYIFPNGILPSMAQIAPAADNIFVLEDVHNFGADYEKTLLAWFRNFDTHWPELREQYGERFYRMWKFYLLSCAGLFRAREAELFQMVLSPKGVAGGYTSVR